MLRGSLGVIRAFSTLFWGVWLIFIANGLLLSSTAIILKNEAQFATGAITACFFIGAILEIFLIPKLFAKIGFVRSYAIISAVFALGALLHIATKNLIAWGAARVVIGFCYYSIVLIAESWLNARAVNQIRSRVLSFYSVVSYAGLIGGALIMGLDLPPDRVFLIAASFVILGQIPLNLTFIKAPQVSARQPKTQFSFTEIAPLSIVTCTAAGLLANGFFTMSPLFAITAGKTASGASLFMVCGLGGAFLAHSFCGKISDRFGRRITIIGCDCVALLAAIALCLSEAAFYGAAIFLGGGICVLYSQALARANDHLKDKTLSVEVGRRLLFCYLLGSVASPILISLLLHFLGSVGYPIFNATILFCLLLFVLTQKN